MKRQPKVVNYRSAEAFYRDHPVEKSRRPDKREDVALIGDSDETDHSDSKGKPAGLTIVD